MICVIIFIMLNDEQKPKSGIDSLEKMLYSREGKILRAKRHQGLSKEEFNIEPGWKEKEEPEKEENMAKSRKGSFFKKFLIAAVIFFVAALGFGLYMFFQSSSGISSNNINVAVAGPENAPAGEELPFTIAVTNNNNVALNSVTMYVTYPAGTKTPGNLTADLNRETIDVGNLDIGQSAQKDTKAVLFGQEGDQKTIQVTVEYQVAGSNAIFHKDTAYNVTISSSPISMTINSLKEINSGQDLQFSVNIVSNSNSVINNVLLTAAYPFGFTFKSATPKPSTGNYVWHLGDLAPQSKRTITITGNMIGQDQDVRVFQFNAGVAEASDQNVIGTTFLASSQSVTIKKPFIGLDLALNGSDSPTFAASAGNTISGTIQWANNLTSQITNAEIDLTFQGNLINKASVDTKDGFYSSSNNTIVWDKTTNSKLGLLNPGDTGVETFTFKTSGLTQNGSSVSNPQVSLVVNVKGNRIGDNNVPEQITSAVSRVVKFVTGLSLASRATYYSGPFKNTGPLPPKVNTPTSYTITWDITDSSNHVSNAQVSAAIPNYMTFLNTVSPASEDVSFNPDNRTITWSAGDIAPDTGINSSPREVSFQVSLLPSISQLRTTPALIGDATLTGIDNFTNTQVSDVKKALNTDLLTDPSFVPGQESVSQ